LGRGGSRGTFERVKGGVFIGYRSTWHGRKGGKAPRGDRVKKIRNSLSRKVSERLKGSSGTTPMRTFVTSPFTGESAEGVGGVQKEGVVGKSRRGGLREVGPSNLWGGGGVGEEGERNTAPERYQERGV